MKNYKNSKTKPQIKPKKENRKGKKKTTNKTKK
jgi:hypothetical protein